MGGGADAAQSDAAVKQLILTIDEQMPCIIMDLDETHLLVNPDLLDALHQQLETEVRAWATYSLLTPVSSKRTFIPWISSKALRFTS